MTILDWILILLCLGTALCGFWKGAIRIVFGIGGTLAGIWLAVIAGPDLALIFENRFGLSWFATVLGYLLPALACMLICFAAGWGLERTLKAIHLNWLNRLSGALLAGLVAVLVLGALIVVASRFSPTWAGLCERSLFPRYLAELLGPAVPDEPPLEVELDPPTAD